MPRREGGSTTALIDGGTNDSIDVAAAENDESNRSKKKNKKTRERRRVRGGKGSAKDGEGGDRPTPTQLRNARKRRAKRLERARDDGGDGSSLPAIAHSNSSLPRLTFPSTFATSGGDGKGRRNDDAAGSGGERRPVSEAAASAAAVASGACIGAADPSMRYLRDPLRAPVVREAREFFEPYLSAAAVVNDANLDAVEDDDEGATRTCSTAHKFRVTVGPKRRWRTVSKLPVRRGENCGTGEGGGEGRVEIGLFQPGSHRVVPASGSMCPAHHPSVNAAVSAVGEACRTCGVGAYDEADGGGKLRYVAVNVERATGDVQLTLVWNGRPPPPPTPTTHIDGDGSEGGAGLGENEGGMRRIEGCGDATLVRLVRTLIDLNNKAGSDDATRMPKRGRRSEKRRRGRDDHRHDGAATPKPPPPTPRLHSLWVHFNDAWRHSNAIFGRGGEHSWVRAYGPRHLCERIDDIVGCPYEIRLPFSPSVFRQANLDAFARIVATIRARLERYASAFASSSASGSGGEVPGRKPRRTRHLPSCVELYAGIGTIGLHVADLFSSIILSDENPHNAGCFAEAAGRLPEGIRRNVSYISKSAEEMVRDGALSSGVGGAAAPDVCIVDPPRKGLDSTVVDALLASGEDGPGDGGGGGGGGGRSERTGRGGPRLLVYVSCGFSAFQRDCRRLTSAGTTTGNGRAGGGGGGAWRLEHAEGFLLFPGSDAIETLAFFVRD